MLTWPEALSLAYPFPPDVTRFPGRPWWVLREGTWSRSGGEILAAGLDPLNSTVVAQVENIDNTYPLTHPGFRVGQVWGNAEGEASMVIGMHNDNPVWGRTSPDGYLFLVHDVVCPWLAPWAPEAT